jgi:transcriptional regulator with XRE-family HTH domain
MQAVQLGDTIKTLRLQLGLSQEALADMAQLNLRTIQRIESGVTAARGNSLQQIAKALQVDVKTLQATTIQAIDNAPALKTDVWINRLLYISAMSFLIFPLLGALLPFAIWIMYRNNISEIHQKGKQLIIIQLLWCAILFAVYAYIGSIKIFHVNLPVPGNQKILQLVIAALYVANIIYCTFQVISSCEIKKYFRQAF